MEKGVSVVPVTSHLASICDQCGSMSQHKQMWVGGVAGCCSAPFLPPSVPSPQFQLLWESEKELSAVTLSDQTSGSDDFFLSRLKFPG